MSQTFVFVDGATSLKDPVGNTWGIDGSERVTVNGHVVVHTSGTVILAVIGRTVWQQNTAQEWYQCAPSRMISSGNVSWDGPTRSAPFAGVIASSSAHGPPPPGRAFSSAFSSSFN